MLRLAAALTLGAALVAACGDDGDAAGSPRTTVTETTVTSAGEPSPSTTAPAVDGVAVDLTVRGGAPEGGVDRIPIPVGERAVITVDTDAAVEIHLHGYDLYADGGPDSPAVIEFEAAIPGIFELELEGSHVLVAEIEVS